MADNVPISAGSGTSIATDEVAGNHYQRAKRTVGAEGFATDFLDKASRADTFTSASNGTTVDVSAQGMGRFALQCKQTGTVTSWTVVLEVSLDNVNFVTILTHSKSTDTDGAIAFTGASVYPALYFRARCTAITLGGGTNVVATIIGLPA